MLQNSFMADLAKAAQQVRQAGGSEIILDPYQTSEFFKNRKIWKENKIDVICNEGEMVKLNLPSFPLPVRTNTTEDYSIEDIAVIPRYGYHSIVNFFLCRIGMNLIPANRKDL